jgi:hypothetical protein
VSLASGAAMADEFRALEHGEVLGDGGLRDAGVTREGVNGLFAVAGEFFEDRPAGGIGESAKDVIAGRRFHGQNHNYSVMDLSRG